MHTHHDLAVLARLTGDHDAARRHLDVASTLGATVAMTIAPVAYRQQRGDVGRTAVKDRVRGREGS